MVKTLCLMMVCAACTPELDDTTTLVSGPRLLGVRVEPAEAAPGASVATRALWVDPTGTLADAPLEWAFCSARKTFSEPGPVAEACLVEASADLLPFGSGADATGTVPGNACRQFGPDAPDPVPGEPAGRPTDPDGTGGFYQPVRVRATEPADYALAAVRLRCGLPGATLQQAAEFRDRYIANANPAISEVVDAASHTTLVALDGSSETAVVRAGATLALEVHWPACDEAPCTGSEPYVWFDPEARALTARREAMRVSWYATAGAFTSSHSGRAEDDAASTFATNTWTAPGEAGLVQLWFVLRDDRGGATWATLRVQVE